MPREDSRDPAPPPTDDYVHRWIARDDGAVEVLWKRFRPKLEGMIRGHRNWPAVRRLHRIEDVVQEVWTRCEETMQRSYAPSGPGTFGGFLRKVTEHTMIDLARRDSAVKRGGGEAHAPLDTNAERHIEGTHGASKEPTPTSNARFAEIVEVARSVLLVDEFTAWHTVDALGRTTKEVEEALGRTPSAVRGLLMRARAKLAARLQEP